MASVSSATTTSYVASTNTSGTETTTSIDWDALIESQVDAKLARATTIETKITANEAKIASYQELQSLLSTLVTSASSLSSSIVNSLTSSVYGARAATITSSGDISVSSVLSMSISSGATTGDYSLTINQIATAQKVLGSTVADKAADLGYAGTVSIGLDGGSSSDISITSGMSLEDIVDAINAQTSTTNVQASIIQVSSTEYELVLSATEDNADIVVSTVSGDDIMNKLGITDSSGAFTNVLQTSQPAIFTLDGIEITRNTNDITDVLSGVTFSLLQTTPDGASLNISIETDTSAIETALETLVTDYNAFRDFVYAQQQLSTNGEDNPVLFGDSTMRDIMNQLQSALTESIGGLSLADLGLSFDETNNLEFDVNTLSTTLTDNLDGVISLLATQVTASSSSLSVVNTGASLPADFTLDLVVDESGNLTSASVGGDSSMFTVSGNSIIGKSGTAYSGLAFTYTGSTSQAIEITSTSGIAAKIHNIANNASHSSTGTLQDIISGIQTQDDSLQDQIDDITSKAELYRTNLTAQYARYQSAISTANSTLEYLSALLESS
ncbi:MAG: flagellar filament capping protein FliD [Pseudomonadota bacterium]